MGSRSYSTARLPQQTPQIFIVNVDGTGLRQLTEGSSENYDPVFAPNGKWIAFVSNRDHDVKTDRSDIFSMRPDGSRQRVLIDGPRNESEPDISPDGRKIAFVSNRVGPGLHIYVASSNGRRVRALTHNRESCHYTACFFNPAWAPDGKHIALLSVRRYGTDLEVMKPDGSERKEFAIGGVEAEGYGTRIGAPTGTTAALGTSKAPHRSARPLLSRASYWSSKTTRTVAVTVEVPGLTGGVLSTFFGLRATALTG